MTHSLLTLFMPPEGYFGDFGMLCGYSAVPDVLDRMRRVFRPGAPARPVLATFIHPRIDAVSAVPGVAWMPMRVRDRGYALLHAKVVVLGFQANEDDGYMVRLIVTTANWTSAALTDSIDLFWSINVAVGGDAKKPSPFDCADLRAALSLFDWLRERADCGLMDREYDGAQPDAMLRDFIKALPVSGAKPRLIDSRKSSLKSQIVERFGDYHRKTRLIIGSGFFEGNPAAGKSVCEKLRAEFQDKAKLNADAQVDLILNPQACQGIAGIAEHLRDDGWRLRVPVSVHHGAEASLHAKFILLGHEDKNRKMRGQVYLGSGNMTGPGLMQAAGKGSKKKDKGGNLEAGVILDLKELGVASPWKNKTNGLHRYLPIGGSELDEVADLKGGADFERPEEPEEQPKAAYLIWEDDRLSAPDGTTSIAVLHADGDTFATTPCDWPAPPPRTVTTVRGGWQLPVVANGVMVAPPQQPMTIEDVLAALGTFPVPALQDEIGDGTAEDDPTLADIPGGPAPPEARYAIRRMMHLLSRLSEAQADVHPRDWQRWCRELSDALCALVKQEHEMIAFFRNERANPLGCLKERRMIPQGVEINLLERALGRIAEAWEIEGTECLWQRATP